VGLLRSDALFQTAKGALRLLFEISLDEGPSVFSADEGGGGRPFRQKKMKSM